MILITSIVSLFLLIPALLFLLSTVFFQVVLKKGKKSIGLAADVTTILLFFSVAHVYEVVFEGNIGYLLIVFSILLATIFTIVDWKTKKEIEILPLFRKVWRLLFILLCVVYALIWLIGVIQYVLHYIS